MNRIFFNHIDRSEALEAFINDKTDTLLSDNDLNWIISREGQHDFKIKCISPNQVFTETAKDPYQIISSLVGKMKKIERKKIHKVA